MEIPIPMGKRKQRPVIQGKNMKKGKNVNKMEMENVNKTGRKTKGDQNMESKA